MTGLSGESFRFMAELWRNNDKGWFAANRERYETHVRRPLKAMAEALTGPVAALLPEFDGLPRLSRINNDLRFTPHKPPYKEHIWISFFTGAARAGELFAGINGKGWFAGCNVNSGKREGLDNWRDSLLAHPGRWRAYAQAIGWGERVLPYVEGRYVRPLRENVPEDLRDLVQAKVLYIVEGSPAEFHGAPEKEFLLGLARLLPVLLFLIVPPPDLAARLDYLATGDLAPDENIERLWATLKSSV